MARGVAIITQSGNIGCNLTMQRRALPLAYLITLGNQAVVGLSAAVATLAEDPRVTAIGLHIEGIEVIPPRMKTDPNGRELDNLLIPFKAQAVVPSFRSGAVHVFGAMSQYSLSCQSSR